MKDTIYNLSIRMYFANVYLRNMYFSDLPTLSSIVSAKGLEREKKLAEVYNNLRVKLRAELSESLNNGVNVIIPFDLDTPIDENSFMTGYSQFDRETGLITAFIMLPKPVLDNECWAVVIKHDLKGKYRYFTFDYNGYYDPDTKEIPYLLVCEFKNNTDDKTPLEKFDDFGQALEYINKL